MKKIGLLLAASLLSLSLVACGGSGSSDTESKASDGSSTTTETEAKSEESKSKETKKGHGQNQEDYDGTGLELFGLSYNDNYINLVDCTAEDFVWFVQGMGINYDTSNLNYKLEPYGHITTAFDFDSDIKVYNPYNYEIFAKDAKISYVKFEVSAESENYDKYKNIIVDGLALYNDISSSSETIKKYIEENNSTLSSEAYVHNKFEENEIDATILVNLPSGQEASFELRGDYLMTNKNTRLYTRWNLPQIME